MAVMNCPDVREDAPQMRGKPTVFFSLWSCLFSPSGGGLTVRNLSHVAADRYAMDVAIAEAGVWPAKPPLFKAYRKNNIIYSVVQKSVPCPYISACGEE
jgi:hypothetical protein